MKGLLGRPVKTHGVNRRCCRAAGPVVVVGVQCTARLLHGFGWERRKGGIKMRAAALPLLCLLIRAATRRDEGGGTGLLGSRVGGAWRMRRMPATLNASLQ